MANETNSYLKLLDMIYVDIDSDICVLQMWLKVCL